LRKVVGPKNARKGTVGETGWSKLKGAMKTVVTAVYRGGDGKSTPSESEGDRDLVGTGR